MCIPLDRVREGGLGRNGEFVYRRDGALIVRAPTLGTSLAQGDAERRLRHYQRNMS